MWLILSLACSTQFGNMWRKPQAVTNFDTAEDSTGNSTDSNNGSNQPPSPLDVLRTQLDPDYCYDQLFGPGATGYFIGYYELAEDEIWYGVEQHVLFSNGGEDTLEGDSCQTTWAVTGIEGPIGSCNACQFSISVSALQDSAQSTCPESLQESGTEWSVSYDILIDDSSSEFYFYNSGDFMASGEGSTSFLSFISDPICYNF